MSHLKCLIVMCVLALTVGPGNAVTVGTTDSGNCSLGGCLAGSSIVYQQLYSSSAFSGSITFNQIAFSDIVVSTPGFQPPTQNAVFESGNFTILLSTTNAPLGTSFPVIALQNPGLFFSGTLGGSFQGGYYDINGASYTYNPSMGNLVLTMIGTNVTGPCCSYLDNDMSGLMSRAYYQAGEGTNTDMTGLVTTFSAVTPLPPTWTMMLIGLAGFGVFAHCRKKTTAPNAA